MRFILITSLRIATLTALLLCRAQASNYSQLPLIFEANQGQTDARVQFLSRGNGHTLFLTSTEAVLRAGHDVFRMKLKGANPASKAVGADPQIVQSNYIIGNDPAKWRTGVANYGRVRFAEVYPGIDLVYYGKDRQLEYDWIVKPGADPSRIRLKFAGVKKMHVDRNGDLVLETASGEVREKKPVVHQEQEIAGRYVIRGHQEAGFEVGPYDTAKPLVIDPVLVYSSYLGGSRGSQGNAIAADSAGNAYVAGWTFSTDFPTVNPVQSTNHGATEAGNLGSDIFVTKVSADGQTLLYSTYLGGDGDDFGQGIAVDSSGNAFVTGWTKSTDFPVANAFQANYSSKIRGYNSFLTKLSPAGNALVFSTYLGGDADDQANAIAVDASGNAYVTGGTESSDFPTTPNAIQGGLNPGGRGFVFLTKMSADGSALLYSTFLNSGDLDGIGSVPQGVAVDASGNAYVAGWTIGKTLITVDPLQPTYKGSQGIFVAKINPSGSAFVYSTYLGGSGTDRANAIAVDSSGNAYVTGSTTSKDFPSVHAMQATSGGGTDAFVTKINPSGSAIVYSTYLGGASNELGFGIGVDAAGEAWVAGSTTSTNFPTVNPVLATPANINTDLFVSQFSADGSTLLSSSYIGEIFPVQGGTGGSGMAVDRAGNAYVTGLAGSRRFPIVNAFQPSSSGFGDAYVLKIADQSQGPVLNDFGVVNNASFAVGSNPLAPGAIAAVFGSHLNNGSSVLFSTFGPDGKLATTLAGAQVTINGEPVPIFYSTPAQLGIQIPTDLTGSSAMVQVKVAGQASETKTLSLDSFSPGLFSVDQSGHGQGAILIANTNTLVAPAGSIPGRDARPAKPGEFITIFCTGLGKVTPALASGVPATSNTTVTKPTVTIDGAPANVEFSGMAPGFVGLNQVNVQIPAGTRAADNIPVVVTIGGKPSNTVTIAVGT